MLVGVLKHIFVQILDFINVPRQIRLWLYIKNMLKVLFVNQISF
jgi:hypothetical protein